jgi:hypothetical protein
MVRIQARIPSLAEILGELKAQRAAETARSAEEPPGGHVTNSEHRGYPPIDLDA